MTEALQEDSQVLYCDQQAGEIVFIPIDVQHGVRNIEHTVAMQMQWDHRDYGKRDYRHKMYRYLLHDLDPEMMDPDLDPLPTDKKTHLAASGEGTTCNGSGEGECEEHEEL